MSESLYLDTCALSRLTDDLTQPRIRSEAEAEAVARIRPEFLRSVDFLQRRHP